MSPTPHLVDLSPPAWVFWRANDGNRATLRGLDPRRRALDDARTHGTRSNRDDVGVTKRVARALRRGVPPVTAIAHPMHPTEPEISPTWWFLTGFGGAEKSAFANVFFFSTFQCVTETNHPPPFLCLFSLPLSHLQAYTSGRLKVASLFSGCGALDYGLTQAGHEIILQTEAHREAREVLAARFQGICQPKEPSMLEELPKDVDLLVASVMDAELEGSWRESWSKDSVASKLKQVLRLMKTTPVAWVLIEAPASLLESDGEAVPVVCDLVSEFERLGYRWAHRTIAAASFGVPDLKPRVFLLGSRHGDPTDVLFTDDAGVPRDGLITESVQGPDGATTRQSFVFNRRPTHEGGHIQVFSDIVEGFWPSKGSCALTPDGNLSPMEAHDAERLQGLPPGWTLTSRPGSNVPVNTGNDDESNRWVALSSSLGCVPAARWIGTKLAQPYVKKFDAKGMGSPFEAAVVVPWPASAFNVGDGRRGTPVSPFPVPVNALPTLGQFIAGAQGQGDATSQVEKQTVLECVSALRQAGWQPPAQLVAVEVAAEAAIAAGVPAGMQLHGTSGEKRPAPAAGGLIANGSAIPPGFGGMGDAAAAQAALAALAPMMAAAAAAEQANVLANAPGAIGHGAGRHLIDDADHHRTKKTKTTHGNDTSKHKVKKDATDSPRKRNDKSGDQDDPSDDSYTVAGITLRNKQKSQIVWAKLPGHPFWPGLNVELDDGPDGDIVPEETRAMGKDGESLVIFYGENSFGWVREDQVLDFKNAYAEKAREPIRNKARFNSALNEALRDMEKRNDSWNPPAVVARGKSGGRGHQGKGDGDKGKHANATPATSGDHASADTSAEKLSAEKNAQFGATCASTPPIDIDKAKYAVNLLNDATLAAAPTTATPPGDAAAAMNAMAAAADDAVKSGRTTTDGCKCRCCVNTQSTDICLRIEAQRMCGRYPVGAMLALQGTSSVGNDIEIYWPLDEVHYVARVTSYDPSELQHMVTYEADGVREFLCLWKEDVKVLDGPAVRKAAGDGGPSAPRAEHAKPSENADVDAAAKPEAGAPPAVEQSEDADAALLMGLQ